MFLRWQACLAGWLSFFSASEADQIKFNFASCYYWWLASILSTSKLTRNSFMNTEKPSKSSFCTLLFTLFNLSFNSFKRVFSLSVETLGGIRPYSIDRFLFLQLYVIMDFRFSDYFHLFIRVSVSVEYNLSWQLIIRKIKDQSYFTQQC